MMDRHIAGRGLVTVLVIGVLLAGATSLFAHAGVKNSAVKARMDAMSAIGRSMKVIGEMAKGATVFDAGAARAAAEEIARQSAATPDLFRAPETDPMTEALPAIWDTFDEFTRMAVDMERTATEVAEAIVVPEDARVAAAALGETCKACHARYRK
ncbi:MAG: cytochrome c [Pseudomonadota bacterium]